MKVHLMYQDCDFDTEKEAIPVEEDLIQDLELNTLFTAMSNDDKYILEIVRIAILSRLYSKKEILYRQSVLKDCIKNPYIIRKIYHIATEAIEKKRSYWWGVGSDSPSSILHNSVCLLQMFVEMLKMLRKVIDEHERHFESEGFKALIKMLKEELDDEYLETIETCLNELKFRNGVLISAELGKNNQGINYILRSQQRHKYNWFKWRFAPSFYINERDDNGLRDLGRREDRAVNLTANALNQSSENVLNFFIMLQKELAFYVGCLNLYDKLTNKKEPMSFPLPDELNKRRHSFKGLYDICLALIVKNRVVGNDIDADNKDLAIITGANQGGKSTFLRSIGQAQIMMQCGMFVPAEYFCTNICNGIFTHYKREEDTNMKSGKLDEELGRMSKIVDYLKPNSMILFNESFAATNEREGSEIGRQVVCALLEKHIKVFFVTHLYKFANDFYEKSLNNAIYLRAERQNDGQRTFKIVEGRPLKTSYGEDLYFKIFNSDSINTKLV